MNLPVGILAIFLVYQLVEDPPYMARARALGRRAQLDYVGFSLLALGVGALQILLDKGQEDDWFGSHFIVTLIVIASVCLTTLVIWELYQKNPIVDVQAVREFQFRYLQHDDVRGGRHVVCDHGAGAAVSAGQHGLHRRVGGHGSFRRGLCFAGRHCLSLACWRAGFQGRYLIAAGWLLLTGSMYLSTQRIDLLISFSSATWLRIAQYAPLGLVFIPTTAAAYYGMPKDKNNAIAGLVNFMRNIGASVGTSVVTTVLARRNQFHQERLGSNITAGNPAFRSTVNGLAQQLRQGGLSAHDALNGAYGQVYRTLATTGFHSVLHRHFLASDGGRRHHVLHDVFLAEERSARRREGCRPLERFHNFCVRSELSQAGLFLVKTHARAIFNG